MQHRKRLFTRSNKILIQLRLINPLANLIQLLVEIRQLRRLRHLLAQHEEGRLVQRISFLVQEVHAVVDQRLVEQDSILCETVSTMSYDFHAANRVVAVDLGEHTVVRYAVCHGLGVCTVGRPFRVDFVVVFSLGDGDVGVDVVSDGFDLDVELDELVGCLVFFGLLLCLEVGDLFKKVVGALTFFLEGSDLLLEAVFLGVDLGCGVLGCGRLVV